MSTECREWIRQLEATAVFEFELTVIAVAAPDVRKVSNLPENCVVNHGAPLPNQSTAPLEKKSGNGGAEARTRIERHSRTRNGFSISLALCFCGALLLVSCTREQRKFEQPPATFKSYDVTLSDIHPGAQQPEPEIKNQSEENAYDVAEGKRLFTQYNCAGCHFNGGGGIGPALMDAEWTYGDKAANIYSTIVEGRPNGMPSFRHKIPDNQVWQIVAYVRAMSGQLRKDVMPTRADDMNSRRSEQRTERKKPVASSEPPSTQHP
jgi:cytochrome c oxidase cbb3-type subunit 3